MSDSNNQNHRGLGPLRSLVNLRLRSQNLDQSLQMIQKTNHSGLRVCLYDTGIPYKPCEGAMLSQNDMSLDIINKAANHVVLTPNANPNLRKSKQFSIPSMDHSMVSSLWTPDHHTHVWFFPTNLEAHSCLGCLCML